MNINEPIEKMPAALPDFFNESLSFLWTEFSFDISVWQMID